MKKAIAVILLLTGAILLGLGLPSAVTTLQAMNAEQVEAAGITEVNLTVSSGLTHMEKLQILADANCTVMNVGIGQHQTPSSLSQHSWKLLDLILNGYGIPLLEAGSTQQIQQFALMASANDQPFIYWEVQFTDGLGNLLRLHLDDETGLPLAMSYTHFDPKISTEVMYEWCATSLYALNDLCGLSLPSMEYERPEEPSFRLPITDGETESILFIQLGENWFSAGDQIG